MYTRILYSLGRETDGVVRETISGLLQTRDFIMVNPHDDRGNSVEELYLHWLGRRLEDMWLLHYRPRNTLIIPSLEIELSICEALAELDSCLYSRFNLPADFASRGATDGFTLDQIGPGQVVMSLGSKGIVEIQTPPRRSIPVHINKHKVYYR